MSDEEIRIKVAKSLGWTHVQPTRYHGIKIVGVPPNATESDLNFPTSDPDIWCALVPNYPEDLNACAEFEETLTDHEQMLMYHNITKILRQTKDPRPAWRSPAKVRCLAYLKTKGILP